MSKSSDDLQVFENNDFSIVTKLKATLKNNLLVDKSPQVAQNNNHYKCERCSFESQYQWNLTRHLLKHKILGNVVECDKKYECDKCSFKTKYETNLKRHKIVHKNLGAVDFLQCSECGFATKWMASLRRHSIVHKGIEDVQLLK